MKSPLNKKYLASCLSLVLAASLTVLLTACGSTSTSTPTPLPANQWTWMGGSNTVGAKGGQPGVYGTQGTAAAANIPGGRGSAASWTDRSGNFWLFGGNGHDSTGAQGLLNDLWSYTP